MGSEYRSSSSILGPIQRLSELPYLTIFNEAPQSRRRFSGEGGRKAGARRAATSAGSCPCMIAESESPWVSLLQVAEHQLVS